MDTRAWQATVHGGLKESGTTEWLTPSLSLQGQRGSGLSALGGILQCFLRTDSRVSRRGRKGRPDAVWTCARSIIHTANGLCKLLASWRGLTFLEWGPLPGLAYLPESSLLAWALQP